MATIDQVLMFRAEVVGHIFIVIGGLAIVRLYIPSLTFSSCTQSRTCIERLY